MSPTIFKVKGLRFYFFSREERRLHVHVQGQQGEAKFWLEPSIELAQNFGMNQTSIRTARRLIEEREDEIRGAWATHFRR